VQETALQRGERLFGEGQLEQARESFLEAVQQDDGCKEALNNLGVLDFQENRLETAAEWFVKSLRVDPYFDKAILNYSDLLTATGNTEQAVELLNMAATKMSEHEGIQQRILHLTRPRPETTTGGSALAASKVLHAPFEVAGNMARITSHLRRLGVNATSANYYDNWLQYNCDINLKLNSANTEERDAKIAEFARQAANEYDIFHFHFAHSLTRDLSDLPKLKDAGKKILFSFWGSDSRSNEWILYAQAKFLGYDPPKPYALSKELYEDHKQINRYADVMFGLDNIPRGLWVRGHADTSAWPLADREAIRLKKARPRDPEITYFVHAPSSNWKKGSSMILSMFEECRKEGMPIEMILVYNLTPEQARTQYAYADYAIDQAGVGTYGLFGVEMMCWQIPVLVYHTPLFDRLRGDPPVINITKANFRQQIERCVQMKKTGEIQELGEISRQWAIEKEDINLGIPVYLQTYLELVQGNSIPQHVNRAWYDEEARMQAGVKSEFYRYMLENRVFEEINVEPPDYDRDLYL